MADTKKTILIAEDDKVLLGILKKRLEEEGFSVLEAHNGAEALEVARREHPDLIILDLIMPVMDGVTMLEKLGEIEEAKKIQVIVLTNFSDSEKVEKTIKAGVRDYLVKAHWLPDQLVEKIKKKLETPGF